jgi:hypothetical protein
MLRISWAWCFSDLDVRTGGKHINESGCRYRLWPTQQHQHSFIFLEELMSDRTFDNPVFVKGGEYLIQEISCLEDALEFLYEWPKNRRGPIHQTALRACQKVYESDYPLSSARDAFAGFAKSARVLEEVTAPLPWMARKKGHDGGLTV